METFELILVNVTFPDSESAKKAAEELLAARLIACASLVEPIRSFYVWNGEQKDEREALLILKTTKSKWQALEKAIRALHSYECPEIVAVPCAMVSEDYHKWVIGAVK